MGEVGRFVRPSANTPEMKHLNKTVGICSFLLVFGEVHAQLYVPPDHKGQDPHPITCWFRNEGQVGTSLGDPATTVHYHSYGQKLNSFLCKENKLVFALPLVHQDTSVQDTLYSWSMQLVGENVDPDVIPEEAEEVDWVHHYYKPWCPNGVTNVPGFRRIVYSNVYPNVDMHLYSNVWGYKLYFVILPGGDPDDITMKFEGQDSLGVTSDTLRVWLEQYEGRLPNVLAYQHIGNTTVEMPWTATYEEVQQNVLVKFGVGGYDPNEPLIFDISAGFMMPPPPPPPPIASPEWASYSGAHEPGTGRMHKMVPLPNNGMAACGETESMSFPFEVGFDASFNGDVDGYYSVFTDQYHMSQSTYFGSTAHDYIAGITPYNGGFAVVGVTQAPSGLSWNGPPGAFVDQVGTDGYRNCFVAAFTSLGPATWRTLYGPESQTMGLVPENIASYSAGAGDGLVIGGTNEWSNPSGNQLPIENSCASPTMDALPICGGPSAYVQSEMGYVFTPFPGSPWTDGFFAKWDDQQELVWSTIFGGSSYLDRIEDLTVDPITNHLVAVGWSNSPNGGPWCQAPPQNTAGYPQCSTSGYYQDMAPPNGVTNLGKEVVTLAEFGTDNELLWSTAFGPKQGSSGGVAIDARHGKIAITGWTDANAYATTTCVPSTGTEFPLCTSLVNYNGALNAGTTSFAAAFMSTTRDLVWSSAIPECEILDIAIGPDNTFLVAGNAGAAQNPPLLANPLFYSDVSLADGGYIAGFDPSGLFFGGRYMGTDADHLNNVVTTGFFDLNRVYVGGHTESNHQWEQFPYLCPPTVDPWCNQFLAEPVDLYYAQLKQHITNVGMDDATEGGDGTFVLYPNPQDGTMGLGCQGAPCANARTLVLIDMRGREVAVQRLNSGSRVYLGRLAPGVYSGRLQDAQGNALGTARILIQP